MKRISSLLLAFLCFFESFGQTDVNRQQLDVLFGNLNRTQVPSGFLAPYGTDLLDKEDFNGVLSDSNLSNSMDLVRMAYADVYTARFYSGAPALPLPEAYSQTVNAANPNALALFPSPWFVSARTNCRRDF